jgi:hypothetical protein
MTEHNAASTAGVDLHRQLEKLLRETGRAHHQAFIETNGVDPEWPLRYADNLSEARAAPGR